MLQNEINVAAAMTKLNPKLVFLDISLNTLDGPLIASIINGHGLSNKYIVTMSASVANKKAVSEDNFLLKPLTKEKVFEKIKSILG